MKKFILVCALFLGAFSANAQFTASVNAGIPVGDVDDTFSFALSGDVGYTFPTNSDIVKFGVSAGFLNYFGKDYEAFGTTIESRSIQFAPISGVASLRLSNNITVSTKLGYSFGLTNSDFGGFYYKPMLGFVVGEKTNLSLFYENINNDGTNISNAGLGLIFGL